MTRAAGTIAVALVGVLGELALAAAVVSDWSSPAAHALLFAFLAGPLLFVGLLAWRRRGHAGRARALFAVAAACALGGSIALGWRAFRFHTVPEARLEPSNSGLVVPLVQWAVVLLVWGWLVIGEARERRAAKQQGGSA